MGEAVGVDPAGRLLLEPVVADGLGGAEGFVEVARLEVAGGIDGAGPDAGVAVGLQLLADRELVRLRRVRLAEPVDLGARSGLPLDVMSHLVGDHVCPGEVAGRAELPLHVLVEAQVEIDALVARAVERADRGGRAAATVGLDGARVEDELRGVIGIAAGRERALPDVLGVVEDVAGEILEIGLGVLAGRKRLRVVGARRRSAEAERARKLEPPGAAAAAADQVDPDHDHDDDQPCNAADAGDAARDRELRAAPSRRPLRGAADVDHVAALRPLPPLHGRRIEPHRPHL